MFEPLHVRETHSIRLPLSADRSFGLFTPEGERHWVPDWEPEYVHPASGRTEQGMVFVTHHGDETTLWCLVDFDPARRYSRYARVTPGSRFVLVEVQCTALNDAATEVSVTYTLTAMTEEGNQAVAGFQGDVFRRMIDEWEHLILERLPTLPLAWSHER